MKSLVYIIVTRKGFDRAIKSKPSTLAPTERAFELEIEVPDEPSCPPMLPRVRLSIPADALYTNLEAELITNAHP